MEKIQAISIESKCNYAVKNILFKIFKKYKFIPRKNESIQVLNYSIDQLNENQSNNELNDNNLPDRIFTTATNKIYEKVKQVAKRKRSDSSTSSSTTQNTISPVPIY